MGIAFERDAQRLAHRGASAVGPDQIGALDPARACGVFDGHLHMVGELLQRREGYAHHQRGAQVGRFEYPPALAWLIACLYRWPRTVLAPEELHREPLAVGL